MNKGKICISVCAATIADLINKINLAAESADVIEVRFDCLFEDYKDAFIPLKEFLKTTKRDLLFTFRPKSQGGNRDLTFDQRKTFWESHIDVLATLIDKEFEMIDESDDPHTPDLICSYHDFEGVSENINQIYQDIISNSQVKIVKIAVQADDLTDSLAVWKLLNQAKTANKKLVPIAMGEAGKWTRILGCAFGSPLTYASLECGDETAPGQISATDLREVYRVKELDEQTEIYGIIGNPVSHSLSPYIHNAAFRHHNLNAVYIPFEVSNLEKFITRTVRNQTREIDWNLKGFSVTIPHKESIIRHLDYIDEDAKQIGAVNTVKIVDGKLYGYNTDSPGFIEPLLSSYGDLNDTRVGIIGNGGAARACIYTLKKAGADVTIFFRNIKKAKLLAEEFEVNLSELPLTNESIQNQQILINATPLGTTGELENQTPATSDQMRNLHLVYDLVYSPFETKFMREAKNADVPTIGGLAMLVAQGIKQFKIWTGLEAPMSAMSRAAINRLGQKIKTKN